MIVGNMPTEKPELVEALANVLGDNVALYFKAQGHHWNVMGRDFSQFHDFFAMIYSDVLAQFDPVAENMRKLGALAPFRLNELAELSQMQDMDVDTDAMLMVQDLYEANNVIIASINNAFKIATEFDEQGIADYLAGRDDIHKKYRWQLTAYLSPTHADSLGKSDAAQPLDADMVEVTLPVAEQPMDDANGCPLCGYGLCECPGSEGGYCLCDEMCSCPHCHVAMYDDSLLAAGNAESAAKAKKLVFDDKTETALAEKVAAHNKDAKAGRKASLPMLKAVYRRGAGAYNASTSKAKSRDQWAMARVNAFLKLLKTGAPANANYKQDNDLLPKAHPKSSRGEAAVLQHELLQVALKSADEYGSPEHAIFSMAEYSGLGYDVIPALRGAWVRGVRDGDIPFERAYELATKLYDSADADLLPKKKRNA